MSRSTDHTIPIPLPHEIQRSHLLSLLSSHPFRLIALLAPSGFGKTTLLSQFARLSPSPFWLSLSDDSQDLLFFCSSLLSSLSPLPFPSFSPLPFPSFSSSLSSDPTPSSLSLAFLSDLQHLPPFHLFLDQIQHLSPSSASFLNLLFPKLPPSFLFLLSGYTPHHLNFSQLLSKNLALTLDSHHLRFSPSEITHYLSLKHPSLPLSDISHLDGWPAGLALQTSSSHFFDPYTLIEESLGDLLTQFPHLPTLATHAIWTQSVFERIGLPGNLLKELWRAGHLLVPLGHDSYKPHRILRLFLEECLGKDEIGYKSAHCLAGQRMEQEGKPIEALKHYKRAKEDESVYRTIRSVYLSYLGRLEHTTVYRFFEDMDIESLPLDLFEIYAVCYPYNPSFNSYDKAFLGEARRLLEEAYRRGARSGDIHKELGSIEFYLGNREKALGWLDSGLSEPHLKNNLTLMRKKLMYLYFEGETSEKEKLISDILCKTDEQENLRQKAVSWAICGKGYVIDGKYAEGMHLLRKSIDVFEKQHNVNYLALALDGMLAGWMGMNAWEKARETWEKMKSLDVKMEMFSYFASVYLLMVGEYEEALEKAEKVGLKGIVFELMCLMGRREEAEIVYEELKGMSGYELGRECDGVEIHIGIGMCILGKIEEGRRRIERGMEEVRGGYMRMRGNVYLGREVEGRYEGVVERDRVYAERIERDDLIHRSIKISTIDEFEIRFRDSVYGIGNKKAREILVFLIMNGESRRKEIIKNVWIEQEIDWNIDYFSDSIYRLRKILEGMGIEDGIKQEKGYYRVSEGYVWELDIEDMEGCEWERGLWMESAESEWFEAKREELRKRRYEGWIRKGEREVKWLEKAVECEPMEEEGYKRLMEVYRERGERRKEEKLKEKMRDIWIREFGMGPDGYMK